MPSEINFLKVWSPTARGCIGTKVLISKINLVEKINIKGICIYMACPCSLEQKHPHVLMFPLPQESDNTFVHVCFVVVFKISSLSLLYLQIIVLPGAYF